MALKSFHFHMCFIFAFHICFHIHITCTVVSYPCHFHICFIFLPFPCLFRIHAIPCLFPYSCQFHICMIFTSFPLTPHFLNAPFSTFTSYMLYFHISLSIFLPHVFCIYLISTLALTPWTIIHCCALLQRTSTPEMRPHVVTDSLV